MRITFWAYGSIPSPGPDTVEIGGNTSCVECALERRCSSSMAVRGCGSSAKKL